MRRYRYRTPVLAGPWRESPDQALRDAERAGQLRLEGLGPRWKVPGEIEEDQPAAATLNGSRPGPAAFDRL
ncbi:hypothetical protein [Sphingosinicella terrae]|uniref:hypothetical protein n=1 Tax=Sphingosinicella terrae TaxID=2172047 RepID=UPI0013B3818B|nr:hypothetical protein [Sphingosinicella terrae]